MRQPKPPGKANYINSLYPSPGPFGLGPALSTAASASTFRASEHAGLGAGWSGALEAGWSRPDQAPCCPVAFGRGPAQLRVAGPPPPADPTRPHPAPPGPARTPTGSDELDAQIERTAPAVLALLADGTPRGKKVLLSSPTGTARRTSSARSGAWPSPISRSVEPTENGDSAS